MKKNITKLFSGLLLLTLVLSTSIIIGQDVSAEQHGELISKQKTIIKIFNEENPEGNVDLKKIVEDELAKPAECDETLVICKIQEVSFEIVLKKEWLKLTVSDMNDHQFANTVPILKNPVDQLTKQEVVIMQETLARRGLLQYSDSSIVKERGFFGALTWLALIRLGNIKGHDPGNPDFNIHLRDRVNELIDNMATDDSYVANHALPKREDMEPQDGDLLKESWDNYKYISKLAENSDKVNSGSTPIGSKVDVNIDGFVNVERVSE